MTYDYKYWVNGSVWTADEKAEFVGVIREILPEGTGQSRFVLSSGKEIVVYNDRPRAGNHIGREGEPQYQLLPPPSV